MVRSILLLNFFMFAHLSRYPQVTNKISLRQVRIYSAIGFKTLPRLFKVSTKYTPTKNLSPSFFILTRQYCIAFMMQKRIKYDSYDRYIDTRPPTAGQTALWPGARKSLEMLCIIHSLTRCICPNSNVLLNVSGKTVGPLYAWHGAWFRIALKLNLTFTLGLTASSRNTYCRIKSSFGALYAHLLNRIYIDYTAVENINDKECFRPSQASLK